MANLVVYKGDDTTGIFGRHLQFTINVQEGVSLVGCVAKFTVHKITKSWSNITPGQQVEIVYTHDETASMPVGGTYGIFQIVDSSNNIRTFDDSVPFLVTNDIRQVYPGSSQATVYVGQMIKWTDIAGRPTTVVQKVNNTLPDANGNVNVDAQMPSEWNTVKTKALSAMQHSEFSELPSADLDPDDAGIRSICTMINKIKNLLKSRTAIMALFAVLSSSLSGAFVETNKLVNLLGKSNVVTAVSLEGLQETLVSGTTIKTINNISVLGSGDISIQTGDPNAITNIFTNGVSIVTDKVADIYGPVREIASSATVTNAGAVAVAESIGSAAYSEAVAAAQAMTNGLAEVFDVGEGITIEQGYSRNFTIWKLSPAEVGPPPLSATIYIKFVSGESPDGKTLKSYEDVECSIESSILSPIEFHIYGYPSFWCNTPMGVGGGNVTETYEVHEKKNRTIVATNAIYIATNEMRVALLNKTNVTNDMYEGKIGTVVTTVAGDKWGVDYANKAYNVLFNDITQKPTTLSGYGITGGTFTDTVYFGGSALGSVNNVGNAYFTSIGMFSDWSNLSAMGQTLPTYLASTEWHGSNKALANYGITNAIPSTTTIETYAINAVSNSASLWTASNAKLTTRINEVAAPIAEQKVSEVMEYGLTNLTANTETFELSSGIIGNLSLDSAHTNINITLAYPTANDKSADILLRVICSADTTLAINSANTDVDGTEWTDVKAGTNYVTATRTAFVGGRSKVLVAVKEVK